MSLKFKEIILHSDLMLVDYSKKLLYLREKYDEVNISETVPEVPGGLWLEYFDDLTWADDTSYGGGHFTWTGTQWEQLSEPRSGRLVPIGGWEVAYRPSHIRIIYYGPGSVRFDLKDVSDNYLVSRTAYNSGDAVLLNWGADIASLEFQWVGTGLTIPPLTIEFFEFGATTTSSTTSTSTTTSSTVSTTSSTASTASTTSSTISTTSSTSTTATASTTSSTATASTTSSSSSSTSTTVTLPGEWISIHSNLYWEDGGCAVPFSWSAFQEWWSLGGGGDEACLQTLGPWPLGLRPSKMRMSFTATATTVEIRDTFGSLIGYDGNYVTGEEIGLIFSEFEHDLWQIQFEDTNSDLRITNIEFFIAGWSTTTTSSTTSTTSTTATQPPYNPLLFHFDEFDDDSIHPLWDNTGTGSQGGTITEQNDRMEILLNARIKGSSQAWIGQDSVKGWDTPGDLNSPFDIYFKLRIPTLADLIKESNLETIYASAKLEFTGGGGSDYVEVQLYWDGSDIRIRYLAYDGSNFYNLNVTAISQNEVWFRFLYLPKTGEIVMYYVLNEPGDWIFVGMPKSSPSPGSHTDMSFRFLASSGDEGRQILTWCEFVRNWGLYTSTQITRGSEGGQLSMDNKATWDDAHDGVPAGTAETIRTITSTGSHYMTRVEHEFEKSVDKYRCYRMFLEFDIGAIPSGSTIIHATLEFYSVYRANQPVTVVAQQAFLLGGFDQTDFNSFTGPIIGQITMGSIDQQESMAFNADGKSAIESMIATPVDDLQICLREFTYDYNDLAPSFTEKANVTNFTDSPAIQLIVHFIAP